ncbi:MAG TPA: carboxypeptidase-like regulatory domain-containing protein [Balneolaceae bacterium]|nr:carboxypeptidase-like regulatory domain-containing protein [Balneolaceae bacterium]
MKFIPIAILFLVLANPLHAQVLVEGKIIDQKTGATLPTANIVIENTYRGTVSNSEGRFSLKVDTFPVSLEVSFLGYKSKKIAVSKKEAQKTQTIALEPTVISMQGITVTDDYASNLVAKAVHKTLADSSRLIIGKAFYRQLTQSDSVYTEFIETFYKAKLSPVKIEDWGVVQGRYAVVSGDSVKGKVTMKDFSVFSRTSWVKDNSAAKDFIWPLTINSDKFYNFYVKKEYSRQDEQLITLTFEPKKNIPKPAFTGELTITDTYSILALQATIEVNDGIEILSFPSKRIDTKNQILTIEYRSTEIDEGFYVPNTIKVELAYDYIRRKGFLGRLFSGIDYKRRIHTQSLLYFHNYKLKGLAKWGENNTVNENTDLTDKELIDKAGYNPQFWENNPIIKRTPVEQQVIESFEKYGSFGKMFNEEDKGN